MKTQKANGTRFLTKQMGMAGIMYTSMKIFYTESASWTNLLMLACGKLGCEESLLRIRLYTGQKRSRNFLRYKG